MGSRIWINVDYDAEADRFTEDDARNDEENQLAEDEDQMQKKLESGR
jgi:hypothetical protein